MHFDNCLFDHVHKTIKALREVVVEFGEEISKSYGFDGMSDLQIPFVF